MPVNQGFFEIINHFFIKDLDGNKLSEEDQVFVIAHPKKVSDDIVDLLLTRY